MKKIYPFFLMLFVFLANNLNAQFGQDVKINPQPTTNQKEVQIDVAFNGWVYAAYNFIDSSGKGGICLRKSTDNGLTWTTFDSYAVSDIRYEQFDLVVAGTDTNSLVVYLAGINHNTASSTYVLYVDRYNGLTGGFIGSNLNLNIGSRRIYDVALATDYRFPAVNSAPYSIGLIYSCYSPTYDSINSYVSIDGGVNFLPSTNIATTSNYYRNVSIAYGRSASASNGRYFFAWEQLGSSSANTGHIYTSRSASTVDGAAIAPVNLDSVSSTMINLCRNPSIAVQFNTVDNDSAAVTAVVTVDRDYNGDGSDYDMLGFYNKRAHFSNFWYRLDIVNSGETDMQSDISYDPTNNNFLLTYLDSTNHKMPYLVNQMNLVTPSTWVTINPNYVNHTDVLGNARPKVVINPAVTQVALAWVKNQDTIGAAYFDAEYSTIQPITKNIDTAICAGDSVAFNGITHYAAGSFSTDTLSAENGIDSVATLNLVVNALPSPVVTATDSLLSTGAFTTYQWKEGGVDISSATAQTYIAPASGSYSVAVTDANGCAAVSTPVNVTVVSVGINALNELVVRVYPNPVVNDLYFDLGDLNVADVKVSDVEGNLIVNRSVNNHYSLNVSNMASGIYLLQITSGNKASTIKFVKQ